MSYFSKSLMIILIAFTNVNYLYAKDMISECSLPLMMGEIKLNKKCVYNDALVITASNTTLDCNGAILDGKKTIGVGITVSAKGSGISNVKIKNCRIYNYTYNGIRIASGVAASELSLIRDDNYKKNARDILISNVEISDIERVGVYLEAYTTNVVFTNSKVTGTGGVAIYLDQATRNNKILNSKFIYNGIKNPRHMREAIAIDSSANNLIRFNLFSNNGLGSIFLYKNCGEKFTSGNSVIRWQHSDNNIIESNGFFNEKIGVWIASRQSYNLKKWDCGDKSMDSHGEYFEDFANFNSVKENKFCNTNIPIKIEGDNNIIEGNGFDNKISMEVESPTSMREKFMGLKTSGNVVTNSKIIDCFEMNVKKQIPKPIIK